MINDLCRNTLQRPQRCKFFCVGGNSEVGRRWRGVFPFLVPVDIGLYLKKILQFLFYFGTKMFCFPVFFLNIV